MKPSLSLMFFMLFCLSCSAQNFRLIITGSNSFETKIIDSLKYSAKHENTKSINDELIHISQKLSDIGYIDNTTQDFTTKNDSIFVANLKLGPKINTIYIKVGSDLLLKQIPKLKKKDTLIIPYIEINSFLNQTIQQLEENGFALARVSLNNISRKKNEIYADLKVELDQKRILNAIVVNFKDTNQNAKFPKGHLAQINRKYKNTLFNQKMVNQIYQDFEKFQFTNQVKYPEILFTKDSTKAYVYLEKRKSNTFDGFIGFSNNETNKIRLNGYADIKLENILGSGELISIYWKSDGNDQKTFNANIELPYLLKSPLGLKAQIQLFRQDSTFQNTKTAIDLSYFANYNTRYYLGYQRTTSSDIQNALETSVGDFNNLFVTASLDYRKLDQNNNTFPIKTVLNFITGTGNRQILNEIAEKTKSNQTFFTIEASHNFNLNKKNSINIKSQNYYLQSNRYLDNELYRFGGFNSIRGFTENSLRAYFTTSILSEYRYIIASSLYVHSILDYCFYKNRTNLEKEDNTDKLLAIGFGFGLQTKNGLLKFALANGKSENQQIQFYNIIAHISYNVKF